METENNEVPVSIVVSVMNKNDIFLYCSSQLESYKTPVDILIVDSLPKNRVGKIDQEEIYKIYLEYKNRENNYKDFDEEKLLQIASNVFKIDNLSIEDSIDSIHLWDSMRHLELIMFVEETFNRKFSAKDIMSIKCLKDIKNILLS
ncbi:hypothetical protein FRA_33c05660 [Francisella sp. W12-1067]|nr:hypothetical protein FRA_33c05660 [Francisella sp. W12-1067]